MTLRIFSIFILVSYIMFIFTGCTTVTRYRTELRPLEVTKYRTERKPVQKLVDVPYKAEVQVPNYIKSPKSKINRSDKRMRIIFLPISSIQDNNTQGPKILNEIKTRIRLNGEFLNKYLIVDESKIKQILGIKDLFNLSRKDIEIIGDKLNIDAVIAGQLNEFANNLFNIKIEVISTKNFQLMFSYVYKGARNNILNKIEEHFYGCLVQSGFKTEFVTKYKKEYRTENAYISVPYKLMEKEEVSVPYQKKVIKKELVNGFFGWVGLVLIVSLF